MSMWFLADEPLEKAAAFGEDPNRPNEFIYHVPEYDEDGNLLPGSNPDYYLGDRTPSASGYANHQPGSFGLGTSIKTDGDVNEAGPAEVVRNPQLDSPGSWGPGNNDSNIENASWDGNNWNAPEEKGSYPYPPAEQLKKDTHWALGAGKSFQWPGGQEAAERGHNIVSSKDFSLENSGSDDDPIPSYRHFNGSRIEPSGDEDAPWQLTSANYDHENRQPFESTTHSSAVAAAMEHERQLKSEPPYVPPPVYYPQTPSYDPGRRSRPSTSRRPRGAPGSRPTNVQDAMRHAVGTASYHGADQASASRWDLRNEGTTFGGHPSQFPGHGPGWMENWVARQFDNDRESGRMQHVIYHHQTPLAWLNVEPGESGDPNAGDARHTWVIPDIRYSNTSSRRQREIRHAIRSTGHGDETFEPYDPDRGFPRSHHADQHPGSQHGYMSRSLNAEDTVRTLSDHAFSRPAHNSRQTPVFIRPTTQSEEPYGWGNYTRTRTHGVYMRPVTGARGEAAWIVGEHDDGTNKVGGSKRFNNLTDALAHADRMHEWIRSGASPSAHPLHSDAQDAAFRRDIRRRRGLDAPLPRTPAVVLPGQEELPFHESSVAAWSDFLREV